MVWKIKADNLKIKQIFTKIVPTDVQNQIHKTFKK